MKALNAFVKQHPVLSYFILTFVISWGGILLVIGGPGKIPGTTAETTALLPLSILAMIAGPTIAGILMTCLVDGKRGVRDFVSRLLRWRVDARWYAIAVLATPLLVLAILLALALVSPQFVPGIFGSGDKITILLTGIAIGLAAGIFEELGWTGFVIPKLRQHYGVFTSGLIVGFLWGVWHYLVAVWGSGDSVGNFSLPLLLPHLFFYIGVLPIYRVLMVWVNDHTDSLLLAILMHASLTGSTLFIFVPLALSPGSYMIWYSIMTVALWVIALTVVSRKQGNIGQRPSEAHRRGQGQAQTHLHPSK